MRKVKPIYHIIYWLFIWMYTYEGFIMDSLSFRELYIALQETLILAGIFYMNLFILIPKLLVKGSKQIYFSTLLSIVFLFAIITFVFDLGQYYDCSNLRVVVSLGMVYVLYLMISFLYWYFTRYQKEKEINLALQNEKLKAELLFLKSQVSPHFLFNSLNNIYSLSIVKDDNAPVMIEKLSDILRYIIYEGQNNLVSLEREIELIKNYIDLQLLKQLKAEENIKFSFAEVERYHKIAPLILINIVENCFKHSDVAYNSNGFLEIILKVENEQLWFFTSNSYKSTNKKAGVGIMNIEQQLKHIYKDSYHFLVDKDEGIFDIILRIDL